MIVEVEECAGRTTVTVLGGEGDARLAAAARVIAGLLPTPEPPPVEPTQLNRGGRKPGARQRVDSSGGGHLATCRCGWRSGPFAFREQADIAARTHRCPA